MRVHYSRHLLSRVWKFCIMCRTKNGACVRTTITLSILVLSPMYLFSGTERNPDQFDSTKNVDCISLGRNYYNNTEYIRKRNDSERELLKYVMCQKEHCGLRPNILYKTHEDLCSGTIPYILALYKSAINNTRHRDNLRATISREVTLKHEDIRVFFLVGKSVNVALEAEKYGDIIQLNMEDTYSNVFHKTASGFLWATQNCPLAKYVLSIDDDILFSPKKLIRILKMYDKENIFMGGNRFKEGPARKGKWGISRAVYPPEWLPAFFNGAAYVMNNYTVSAVLNVLDKISRDIIWMDDVVITGFARISANISETHLCQFAVGTMARKRTFTFTKNYIAAHDIAVAEVQHGNYSKTWKLLTAEHASTS